MTSRCKEEAFDSCSNILQLTRLIPDAKGTKCNVELEPVEHTKHSSILRVPFKTDDGKDLRQWVSRFDIYPYLYHGGFRILLSRFLTYLRGSQTWSSAITPMAI
uniref:sucrose synthase n=1 Tax=Aegilops tauschii subsp. strangulata TaxID=200361 RepID=A0A453Q7Y0_AEGTS